MDGSNTPASSWKRLKSSLRTTQVRLERLLEILSEDIATASDEEVLDACADLKISPRMKGTMAFIGVKGLYFPYRPQVFPPLTAPRSCRMPTKIRIRHAVHVSETATADPTPQ